MAEQYDYQGFHFFPQREWNPNYIRSIGMAKDFSKVVVCSTNPQDWTNFQIIQDVKNNPQNWRLEEVVVHFDRYYGEEKKILLIHKTAQAIYDSNRNLIFNNSPLYYLERFNARQRFEIKQVKNISSNYLVDKEIKWAVREAKENPNTWQFKEIDGQVYLVHNSAEIKVEEIGTLIHSEQKFSETEKREINESLISYQEQKHLASLIKQRKETKDKIQGNIEEVIRFKTWWSNYNVATVIDYHEGYYNVFVVVYEPAHKGISEILETFEISDGYDKNSLESAKSKASSLRSELNGENPILAIHPSANSCSSFSEIIKAAYVIKIDVPYETKSRGESIAIPTLGSHRRHGISRPPRMFISVTEEVPNKNPDQYLKPLDVVWVKKISWGIEYYHVGVYLGMDKVCHFSSEGKGRETNRTMITNWEIFTEGCISGEVFGYHSVIPFKHYELITKQIDWAQANNYDKGWYCLPNNNCEHHANSFVFGIDYSQQVKEQEPLFWPKRCKVCDSCRREAINNGKGSSVNLTDEIKETNNELGKNVGSWYKKIKDEYETKTVVPPKDCKIM